MRAQAHQTAARHICGGMSERQAELIWGRLAVARARVALAISMPLAPETPGQALMRICREIREEAGRRGTHS
jgi:hypothetical protein